MTINIPILLDGLEWATREHEKQQAGLPSHWDQGDWLANLDDADDADGVSAIDQLNACNTSGCLAGYLVARNLDVRWEESEAGYHTWMVDGEALDVEVEAENLIGAASRAGTCPEVDRLFGGDNDIYDLWRISENLTDGAIQMPSKLQDEQALLYRDVAEMENAMRNGTIEVTVGHYGELRSPSVALGGDMVQVVRHVAGGPMTFEYSIELVQ